MEKTRREISGAKAFVAEWQKRYKITLQDVSEDMLQSMEEYAGRTREQAAHPDVEQILNRVADHEITPAKAMELLQDWCDCASGSVGDGNIQPKQANNAQEMPTYPRSGWELGPFPIEYALPVKSESRADFCKKMAAA